MHRFLLFLLTFTLLLNSATADTTKTATPAKTPKLVFIIVDGIPPDSLKSAHTPAIDSISETGGFTEAWLGGDPDGYSRSPTISAVGYNSLITGTWANKHNVWGNAIREPNHHYWNIFRLAHEIAPERKTAIYSTWLDNRTKLIGHGNEAAGNPKIDYHFDGFENDKTNFPSEPETGHIRKIDIHVATEAARHIRETGPDLSWVYLQYTDDTAHRYGDSPQFTHSIEEADQFVGAIWESVQHRTETENEEWMIVVTTDHGRDPNTGKHHGGHSARERSIWIATNYPNTNSRFIEETPAIVDLYPTFARFLNIEIPTETARELDGVPLIGPISAANPKATRNPETETIELTWDVLSPEGEMQIHLTETNHFKEGGKDEYRLVKTVPLKDGKATLKNAAGNFYKIILEAPHNTLNQWIVTE